jgi:hypothetical protein
LTIAQQAHAQLEEQKQENLLLKETIDRMRFEVDEMRSGLNLGLQPGTLGLPGSKGTISNSLGEELAGKLRWEIDDEGEDANAASREKSLEEEEREEGSNRDSVEEDVIQKVMKRNRVRNASYHCSINLLIHSSQTDHEVITTQIEENKEYSDSSTPYTAEFVIQVDLVEEKKVKDASMADPLPRVMVEMDVQTEGGEIEEHEEHDDSLASSSSTIKLPTPRPITSALIDTQVHHHEPPVERPAKVPAAASSPATKTDPTTGDSCGKATVPSSASRIGRFYSIYNTYIYGTESGVHHSFPASFVVCMLTSLARQAAMWAGASAALLFFLGPYMAPAPYGAGPTYADRYAWNSFNALHAGAGEGFVGPAGRFGGGWFGFGAAGAGGVGGVVAGVDWNIFGRAGGGAARIARGWPT